MRRAGVVGTTHTPWSVGTGGVASSGRRAPRRPAPAKPPRPSGSGRWTRLADPRFRYPLAVAARAAARCVAGPAVRLPGYGGGRRARPVRVGVQVPGRSEEHTSELQSRRDLVCRLLLEKKKKKSIGFLVRDEKQKESIQMKRCVRV